MVCELYLNKEVGKKKKKEAAVAMKQADQDRVLEQGNNGNKSEKMLWQENAEWEVPCVLTGGETCQTDSYKRA